MNKIEEQIKKFLLIKQKLPTKEKDSISKFSGVTYYSFLSFFNKKKYNSTHKNLSNNMLNSNQNLTDKSLEQKQKEIKKLFPFVSQKPTEKNKSKTQQGKNQLNTGSDIQWSGYNPENSPKKEITLLDIENNNIGGKELTKILAKKEKKEKTVANEQENNKLLEAVDEEILEQNNNDNKHSSDSDLSFEEEDKDKNNVVNNEDEKLKYSENLELRNNESGMNEPNNFEIFDTTKINEQNNNPIDFFCEQNNISFDEKDRNADTLNKKNDVHEGLEKMKIEEEIKKEEKKEFKKPSPKKEKEKEIKRNSSKICIPLDENEKDKENEKEKVKEKNTQKQNDKNKAIKPQSSKTSKTHKINTDNKTNLNNINHTNTKNKDEKFLQKKVNRNSQSEARPSTNINKGEISPFHQKNSNMSKSKKIIEDDEEDEEYIPKEKEKEKGKEKEKNKEKEKEKEKVKEKEKEKEKSIPKQEESIVTNEGSKFRLNFGLNENDTNKKNNLPEKEISINIESLPENKNNNKNKNGTNNTMNKISNSNSLANNYDISCLDNIYEILTSINNRLKENFKRIKENNAIQKCFNLINEIKKNDKDDLIKRKKDTYSNIYELLRTLFDFFCENKISKDFNNEIVAICIHIETYYKNVKKHDNSINKKDTFYKKKLYFKYAFSKLELRNYDKASLKELCSNASNNNENSNSTKTNNNYEKLLKFTKTSKRYLRTSSLILKEVKIFLDKLKEATKTEIISQYIKIYDNIYKDIQTTPQVIAYNRLFYHFKIIFSIQNEMNDEELKKEIEKSKKKENHNVDERKKGKSMQVHKNGILNKREASMNNIKSKNNK